MLRCDLIHFPASMLIGQSSFSLLSTQEQKKLSANFLPTVEDLAQTLTSKDLKKTKQGSC